MSARYYKDLDLTGGVRIWVDFSTERGTVVNYRAVLLLDTPAGTETIRVYDGAHGYNEMHRYTRRFGSRPELFFTAVAWVKGCELRSKTWKPHT